MPGTLSHSDRAQPYEPSWDSSVKFVDSRQQLSIHMVGWNMSDEGMQEWCTWFRPFSERLRASTAEIVARDVNVSENQLTSVGVRLLLETLAECGVSVLVLKLHHNRLEDGIALATFVRNSCGTLREIHLSHNELTTDSAANIMLAAAMAKDGRGAFCYPRIAAGGNHVTPLWMRIEQNYVSQSRLLQQVEPSFRALGREGVTLLCSVSSKACTPHSCAQHRHLGLPVIHTKNLSNQRSNPKLVAEASRAVVASDTPEKRGQDILSLLFAKEVEPAEVSASKELQPEKSSVSEDTANVSTVSDSVDSESTPEEQLAGDPDFTGCIVADVLRWDEELCKWVKDVIEIPKEEPRDGENNERFKISEELGHMMGDQLKSILRLPTPCEPFFSTTPASNNGRRNASIFSTTPALPQTLHGVSHAGLENSSFPAASNAAPIEDLQTQADAQYAKGSRAAAGTSRSSRRGSQPSSCDVKQSNGFALNPHATEFFPTFSSEVKVAKTTPETTEYKLASIVTRQWNPDAVEFEPSSIRHGASGPLPRSGRGISESLRRMNKNETADATPPKVENADIAETAKGVESETSVGDSSLEIANPDDIMRDSGSGESDTSDALEKSEASLDEVPVPTEKCEEKTDSSCGASTIGEISEEHVQSNDSLSLDRASSSAREWLEAATVDVASSAKVAYEPNMKTSQSMPRASIHKVVRLTISMISAVVVFGTAINVARRHFW